MIDKAEIILKDVYKSFKIYSDKAQTIKERMLFWKRRTHTVHEVLKGISLTINKGEVVGLVGENGCGKSTTLKLMTRILYPEQGSITVKGRVSSLLELGAGFHPDVSGRDNIYTNAAIFGLSKKETDARLDQIIEFSELEEYIDNPVRTYSSGMYMRLAFSVAINVDADVLLIDEILAVGDANFQAKCYAMLNKLKQKGVTIVIVSHDTGIVEKFCTRAIWMKNGEVMYDGNPTEAIDTYLSYMHEKQMARIRKKGSAEEIRAAESEQDADPPVMEKLVFAVMDPTPQTGFAMQAHNVQDDSGVKGVMFKVWNDEDSENEAVWMEALDKGNGDWEVFFSTELFANRTGLYKMKVYGVDNAGNEGAMGTGSIRVIGRVQTDLEVVSAFYQDK